jgi:phosphatidylinositol glycan class C protein
VEANTPFEDPLMQFLILIWFTFFLVVLHNKSTYYSDAPGVLRKTKVRHRLTDAIFMAILLRFLAAVLKTLTASYSSDTVDTLAMASLLLHLLACDYSYANGFSSDGPVVDAKKRPTFQGGTLSLTAAFFATTLLASRLQSNAAVYIFVSFSVILFALYPAARHQVAINTKTKNRWGTYYYFVHSIPLCLSGGTSDMMYILHIQYHASSAAVPPTIMIMLAAATFLLLESLEIAYVLSALAVLCIFVPLWIFLLQRSKIILRGPWDIAHV